MIVPYAVSVAQPVLAHAQYFGIALAHPRGTRAAGRGQQYGYDVFVQPVYNAFQPVKRIYALFRLERRPCEYAYRHYVAMAQLHKANVFFKHMFVM